MTRAHVVLSVIALLSAWIGAGIVVAAVVAPSAFAVLPTRTMAGALVGRVLPVIFWSGITLGGVGALISVQLRSGLVVTASLVMTVICCGVAQLIISPRIESIRESVGGPIDALAIGNPRRQSFGQLHGISVLLMGIAVVGALVAVLLLSRSIASAATAMQPSIN